MACHRLADDLERLYHTKEMSDVVLSLFNVPFHTHSFLLCSRSPVLKDLVCQQAGNESRPICLSVDNLLWGHLSDARHEKGPDEPDPALKAARLAAFEACLKFIYTDALDQNIPGLLLAPLIQCANKLHLLGLVDQTVPLALASLNIDNACHVWTALGDCPECRFFVVQNFHQIFDAHPARFAVLSVEQMLSLVQEDGLAIGTSGEEVIWELVALWAKEQATSQNISLVKVLADSGMLPYIKFPLLSKETLLAISNSQLVHQDYLHEALSYNLRRTPSPECMTGPPVPGTVGWRRKPRGQAMPLKPPPEGGVTRQCPNGSVWSHKDNDECRRSSTPTDESSIYTGPLKPCTANTNPRAMGMADGCNMEGVVESTAREYDQIDPVLATAAYRATELGEAGHIPAEKRATPPPKVLQESSAQRDCFLPPENVHSFAKGSSKRGRPSAWDPRSPTTEIRRSPLVLNKTDPKKSEAAPSSPVSVGNPSDPRSATAEIRRTPLSERHLPQCVEMLQSPNANCQLKFNCNRPEASEFMDQNSHPTRAYGTLASKSKDAKNYDRAMNTRVAGRPALSNVTNTSTDFVYYWDPRPTHRYNII